MEKCIILKNGLDYQKKRAKKRILVMKTFLMNSKSLSASYCGNKMPELYINDWDSR